MSQIWWLSNTPVPWLGGMMNVLHGLEFTENYHSYNQTKKMYFVWTSNYSKPRFMNQQRRGPVAQIGQFREAFWPISLLMIWAVREITSNSTFYVTNISINIVFFPLHDNFVWHFVSVTKFSSIYLAKWVKRLVFRLSFVNLQLAKDGTHVINAKYRYVFVA